jgi:cytochrome c oxidase subunit 4
MSDHHENLPAFCHPVSVKLLLGVFFALIGLTILTVVASGLGMPSEIAFPIAMFIATIKAFLVCAFFMHMWWDKSINVVTFLASLLFVALFIGLTKMDTGNYQNDIDLFPREPEANVMVTE